MTRKTLRVYIPYLLGGWRENKIKTEKVIDVTDENDVN